MLEHLLVPEKKEVLGEGWAGQKDTGANCGSSQWVEQFEQQNQVILLLN